MQSRKFVVPLGFVLLVPNLAFAIDASGLSARQPLTVEDAYPASHRSLELNFNFRWDHERDNKDAYEPFAQIKYGAFENVEVSFSMPYRFGDTSDRNSGQAILDSMYRFTDDQGWMPALAISPSVGFPIGQQEGTETTVALLATKSLTGQRGGPSVHLNATWSHIFDPGRNQREDRYIAVVGYSHPLSKETTLVVDFVREQARTRDQTDNLIEVGFRQQLAESSVFSLGVGAGIGERSPLARVSFGFQRSF